jgi:hypothetical protein
MLQFNQITREYSCKFLARQCHLFVSYAGKERRGGKKEKKERKNDTHIGELGYNGTGGIRDCRWVQVTSSYGND